MLLFEYLDSSVKFQLYTIDSLENKQFSGNLLEAEIPIMDHYEVECIRLKAGKINIITKYREFSGTIGTYKDTVAEGDIVETVPYYCLSFEIFKDSTKKPDIGLLFSSKEARILSLLRSFISENQK